MCGMALTSRSDHRHATRPPLAILSVPFDSRSQAKGLRKRLALCQVSSPTMVRVGGTRDDLKELKTNDGFARL